MLKRVAAVSIVLTLAVAGTAYAASLSKGAKVTLHTASVGNPPTNLGKVLATSTGRTLYLTTTDSKNKPSCTGACAKQWPPLLTKSKPVAGKGVKQSKLGTAKVGKKLQVTYNGHPLYTDSVDTAAGQANGEGYMGAWFVVTAAGKPKK
jgi:predicted lipoprotein with Yx(FWY)xxD motif